MPAAKKTHDSLASALAAAQGEMNDARLGGSGNFGHYADLPSLRAACVPVLSSHGIAVVQIVTGDGSTVSVTTRLLWGSETLDCGPLVIPVTGARGNLCHAIGSAVTYGRRYTLGGCVMLAASEDDEGEALAGTVTPAHRPARMDKAGQAKAIMREEIGCKTKEHAEAVIRFATDCRLGVADLDTEGEEILAGLRAGFADGRNSWAGYLKSAVSAWEEQA